MGYATVMTRNRLVLGKVPRSSDTQVTTRWRSRGDDLAPAVSPRYASRAPPEIRFSLNVCRVRSLAAVG